ncbi:MAG: hypothetical protein J6R91_06440 [Bacteroidaceae bacterium]|nr:hypothetical protein [Bacteroidaceae bacterium]
MNKNTTTNKADNGQAASMNFSIGNITINGAMFDIHDNTNVYINAPEPSPAQEAQPETEHIKACIMQLQELQDKNGKYMFTNKGHWYVVYKVLSEYYRFPEKMSDFSALMADWGMKEARVPIDYETLKKESQQLTIATKKHAEWHKVVPADKKTMHCIELATAFLNLLKSN